MQEEALSAIRFLARNLGDSFGVPARLRQFVADHHDLCVPLRAPPESVAAGDVVRWQWWDKRELQYWRGPAPYYGATTVDRDDLNHFVIETVDDNWSCEIRDVVGLSASRANLSKFHTLDELAETVFPGMLHPASERKIRELLKKYNYYNEVSGITDPQKRSGRFWRYMWDGGRVHLANSVDMHPLVAARYIAGRIGVPVRLYGKLHTFRINLSAALSLTADFDIYTMPGPSAYVDFGEAMRMFGAPYGVYSLPCGVLFDAGRGMTRYRGSGAVYDSLEDHRYQSVDLILLPRADKLAMRVSSVLRQAGLFDAGRFILETAHGQEAV